MESSCLGSNDVRIKVELGGICGSDLKAYKGELGYVSYPVRMGHELVGRVIDCGADVSLKRGERVVVQPNLSCGQCEYCINKKKEPLQEQEVDGDQYRWRFFNGDSSPCRERVPH